MGIRTVGRVLVDSVLAVPVLALVLAVVSDRGADGEPRFSRFGIALLASDPFVWTCATNSVLFATAVSVMSMVLGTVIGWGLGRSGLAARWVWRGMVGSLLAVVPAFSACGIVALCGAGRQWPWPFALGRAGMSLESWLGLPLWAAWAWSVLPASVAAVALSTARAVERLDPAGADAASMMGGSRTWAWYRLRWPVVRPVAARMMGLVFLFSLMEPGAARVLGLRRTLAFQVVDAAGQAGGLGRAAALSMLAGAIGYLGWICCQWWGRGWLVAEGAREVEGGDSSANEISVRRARGSRGGMMVAGLLVVGLAVIAWVPIFELGRVAISSVRIRSSVGGEGATAGVWMAKMRRFVEPPVWQLILNSLKLSLCAVPMVAVGGWLARVFGGNRKRDGAGRGVPMTPLSVLPPMVQGVAILCLPGLLQLLIGAIPDVRPGGPLSEQLRAVSGQIDLERNPWIWLMAAAVVVVGQPFWIGAGGRAGATTRESRTGWDAALLIGPSRRRAAGLCRPRRLARDVGWLIAVGLVMVTNVTPSILFSGLPGCWTMSVGVIELFDASGDGRGQAAALAVLAVGINLAAVGLFRITGQNVDRQVGAR